jgi:hypothetical protein
MEGRRRDNTIVDDSSLWLSLSLSRFAVFRFFVLRSFLDGSRARGLPRALQIYFGGFSSIIYSILGHSTRLYRPRIP